VDRTVGLKILRPFRDAGSAWTRTSGRRTAIRLLFIMLAVTIAAATAVKLIRRSHPSASFRQLTFRRGVVWTARFDPSGDSIV